MDDCKATATKNVKGFDVMPGKRKRSETRVLARTEVSASEAVTIQEEDSQAVFRRYFEDRFKPLETSSTTDAKEWGIASGAVKATPDLYDTAESESDWSGVASVEGMGRARSIQETDTCTEDCVEVVELTSHGTAEGDDLHREELRAFMVGVEPKKIMSSSC